MHKIWTAFAKLPTPVQITIIIALLIITIIAAINQAAMEGVAMLLLAIRGIYPGRSISTSNK